MYWNFKINIRQIRAFQAVIVSGSVSKAAITLRLTQPAVSKLLKNLEETVGYELFLRVNGRISPTPQASYLFQEVDSVLSQMDRLDDLFESAKVLNHDRIKIGSIAGPSNFFIPNVMGKFLKSHNNISTTLITRGSAAISDSISCQMLDIGLIDVTGISPNYNIAPVPVSFYCAVKKTDPLSSKPYITPSDLDGKPLITLPKGQAFLENIESAFQEVEARLNIVHEIFVHMPAISMVREGLGYALVDTINMWSYENYLKQNDVTFVPFRPLVQENLAIITPTIRPLSSAIIELVEILRTEILEIEERYNR